MKSNIEIRKANQNDTEELKNLDTTVSKDPQRAVSIEKWLSDDVVLIAEIENSIVGYGVLNHAFLNRGQVDMLMVHKDFRGNGIGGVIMQSLEAYCDTDKFYVTTVVSHS